jgi:Putative glycosyl/glycerophosphate transferases involved in teichoic acid biosynthesis TagF/TagB/EpsJ/RodC
MDQNEETLTKSQFNQIFLYKNLHSLFLTNIRSHHLVNYYMNFFLTNKLYKKSNLNLQNQSGISTYFNKIDLAIKAIYILKQAFTPYKSSNNLDILFLSRNRLFNMKTREGKNITSDYLFGNIIHELKLKHQDYKIVLINMHFEPTLEINDIKAYSIVRYSTPSIFFKSFIVSVLIHLKWKFCKDKFHHFLKNNHCDYLFPSFEEFFSIKWIFYVYLYDYSLQNILNTHKPKLVMANDDVMYLKPKSNFENLKFVFLQSASIDYEKEYFKKMFINTFSLSNKVADYFLVSGTKFERIKRIFSDSKECLVVGQPRYDILHYVNRLYNKKIFLNKYKINPSHKIILWTTQCHSMSDEENQKNLRTVFSSIEKFNDITLIIKQHPDEGARYTKMIMEFLNKYSINVIFPPTNSDIYEQLYICDLMITKNSTTAIEALVLGKPIIVLNLGDEPDIMDYVEKGVALGVYKEEELKNSINKIIKNDIDFTKNRESYIYESLYRIDGRSSERVVTFIEDLMIEYGKRKY